MDPLGKLFGSSARVKLLRLFLFNDDASFTVEDASFRTKTSKHAARKEINQLLAAGLIRKKSSKSPISYCANQRFTHYESLKAFLRTSTSISDVRIAGFLKKAGTLRLIALSGLFTGVVESKVDLLVVGDRLDERVVSSVVRSIEAELGRELRYAAFATADYRYRVGVYDRLIRDVFDYPHRVVLDKIGVV